MVTLLLLRQSLIVILPGVCAFIQYVWGKGQFDYIIEDMWVGLDKELILSIPLFHPVRQCDYAGLDRQAADPGPCRVAAVDCDAFGERQV